MSDIEIATLKAEIVRLNKLITILIEQNEALKEQIAVANISNTVGNIPLADTNITNGNTNIPLAYTKTTEGNSNAGGAFANITKGNNNFPLAL